MLVLVPVILCVVAIGAGAYGIKKMVNSGQKIKKVKEIKENIKKIIKDCDEKQKTAREEAKKELEDLGMEKLIIMAGSLEKFINIYSNLKNVNFKEIGVNELENFKPDNGKIKEQKINGITLSDLMKAGAKSVSSSVLLAIGTYGSVSFGGFAVASTGTAIGTLHGAALTNATLAWLGGGSLAAGGFGMAGGTVVLGGIIAGPALLLGGVILDKKAEKILYEAMEKQDEAEKIKKDVEKVVVMLNGISERAKQVKILLKKLNNMFDSCLNKFEKIVRDFGYNYAEYPVNAKHIVAICAMFAKIIKIIIDTPILTEDGVLTDESGIVINCFTAVADSGDLDKDDLAKFIRNYNDQMGK